MQLSDRAKLAREDRTFTSDQVEIRAADDGTITFDGIASTVDHPYVVRDMFGEFNETMTRGTFNKTLKEQDDVRLLVNHLGVPVARTKSGTLKLSADPHLRAVAPSLDPANPTVQEIRSALGRKDIDQMSIGMRVTRQDWNEDYTERTIREVQLFDVSIVTFPANDATSASLRSLDEAIRALTSDEGTDVDTLRRVMRTLEKTLTLRAPDDMSFDMVRDAVCDALCDYLASVGAGDNPDVYVIDMSDTWAVYCVGMSDYYRVDYTMADDGTVTFSGAPTAVSRVTSYQPMASEMNSVDRTRLEQEMWRRRLAHAAL